jgi:N-acetylglucosaminyldiphosphoundecaprenol N-acetyl-beta-D-mannosaminyltransferase
MSNRIELLGGSVDLVTSREVMEFIGDAVVARRRTIIGNHNLHSLYLSRRTPALRAFFSACDLIEIDSMPLVFWARLLGLRLSRAHRSTYLDWRDDFWRRAVENRWRVFCLGSTAPVNAAAVARLRRAWPGLLVAGHHGYFDKASDGRENAEVVAQIKLFRPDVLLVGMGMPVQEAWIVENADAFASGVILSLGAAFDYEAGAQQAAPRLYGRLGLEWLYRLVSQPRRLFRRYLIEPWFLVGAAFADLQSPPRLADQRTDGLEIRRITPVEPLVRVESNAA